MANAPTGQSHYRFNADLMLYNPPKPAARQAQDPTSSSVPDIGPSLQDSKSKSHSAVPALLVFWMKPECAPAKVISP